jgi:hypothetical protein
MIKTLYQIDAQIEVELDESGLVQMDIFTPGSVTVHMVLGPEEFARLVKTMVEFSQDPEFKAVLANYEGEEEDLPAQGVQGETGPDESFIAHDGDGPSPSGRVPKTPITTKRVIDDVKKLKDGISDIRGTVYRQEQLLDELYANAMGWW